MKLILDTVPTSIDAIGSLEEALEDKVKLASESIVKPTPYREGRFLYIN
jgi:hypothetical protein